jgi:hypothetical protein
MATPATPAASADPAAAHTHGCVRCGKPVPLDVAMCEDCNPLGLSDPASTQVHGTVFLAVLLAVIALAVLGRLALSGVGPFTAAVTTVVPTERGLAVTLSVRNDGSKAAATTCRIVADGTGATAIVQTRQLQPGETTTLEASTTRFGRVPVSLTASCPSP